MKQSEGILPRLKESQISARYWAHRHLLSNRSSRSRFRSDPRTLTAVQQRALDDLVEDGIATVPFDELFEDKELWQTLAADMGGWADEASSRVPKDMDAPKKKDDFLIRRYREAAPRFAVADPWIRFGVSDEILNVVNGYRGLWTKLLDIDSWLTIPFGGDHDRVGSQRWHRDPWDQHVTKVFIYFSDVDDEAGPFEYIPGSPEGGRYGDVFPWRPFVSLYPSKKKVAKLIPESERLTVKGSTGTVIFCDTSGFHRGGFARSKARLISYLIYLSPASIRSSLAPERFFSVSWEGADGGGLSDSARFALS